MNTAESALRSEVLALTQSADRLATEIIAQQFACDDNHRVVLIAQLARMLRTFQAIDVLVSANLNDAAGAVLRCLLEQYFVFRAVSRDADLMQKATAEVEAESHKALKGLLRLRPEDRADELTEDVLNETLGTLQSGSGFNAFDWAARTGMEGAYLTLYRILSPYAHGSLSMIDKYVELNAAGQAERVRSRVAEFESTEFLLCALSMLLECVEAIDRQPNTEARRASLAYHASEQRRLYARHWSLLEQRQQLLS
ncbi:DUF5677 domain-containing protein [Ramlibacter albus]|uniref:Uncharacterized protein n=1 Tax=Ramlibacter albus TaxID=2079448 RepID=A0A923MAM3_9BURK|nr:DUF5677 domain-containing protein [Ramlibacter albus]MBC5766741.1 hypothetical protein [Ramlibacter albus]